ncbi:hypothetical protein G9A89_000699 [Geosiphon pyriformis]|nr:hypothetical protein G9A89_000699 [Geosiphon pyriformis]
MTILLIIPITKYQMGLAIIGYWFAAPLRTQSHSPGLRDLGYHDGTSPYTQGHTSLVQSTCSLRDVINQRTKSYHSKYCPPIPMSNQFLVVPLHFMDTIKSPWTTGQPVPDTGARPPPLDWDLYTRRLDTDFNLLVLHHAPTPGTIPIVYCPGSDLHINQGIPTTTYLLPTLTYYSPFMTADTIAPPTTPSLRLRVFAELDTTNGLDTNGGRARGPYGYSGFGTCTNVPHHLQMGPHDPRLPTHIQDGNMGISLIWGSIVALETPVTTSTISYNGDSDGYTNGRMTGYVDGINPSRSLIWNGGMVLMGAVILSLWSLHE